MLINTRTVIHLKRKAIRYVINIDEDAHIQNFRSISLEPDWHAGLFIS